MKLNYLYLVSILFVITSCSVNKADKFVGEWQKIDDPSEKLIVTQSGKNFIYETSEESGKRIPGTYNSDKDALEFDNGTGTTITFIFDPATHHLLASGEEFEKIEGPAADALSEDTPAEETPEEETNIDTSEPQDEKVSSSKCAKGDPLVINGNNVRLRTEPDVTKQNILLQLNKGNEVVRLDDKDVDGQKWFKVCHDGQTGWVSGQFASLK